MNNRSVAPRVTIKDVAAEAKTSFGTVSRVINNDEHVAPETRERVLFTMKKLGYVVNRQAASLAGGKSHVIGLLVPDLGTGYIGEIIRGVDAELEIGQYDLMLYTTHRLAAKEANYVNTLMHGLADGLLLVLPRNPADYIEILSRRHFPFVLIDHQGSGEDCPAVGATNWQGAFNATEYLVKLGHTRIGFITGSMDLGAATDRLEGYKSALHTYHVPHTPGLVYEGNYFQASGYNGTKELLAADPSITAIFASNDVMSMGVYDATRELGLRIPEDISVVGFDDIPQSTHMRPQLTTVRQPLEQMGRMAAQMLLDKLRNQSDKMNRIELPTELVIRESTCPPKTRPANSQVSPVLSFT